MQTKYKILLLYIIFSITSAYAQDAYTIDDYGTYILENGIIQKVPQTIGELFFWRFIENYAVFTFVDRSGYFLYNIDNGAISEVFGQIPFLYKNFMGFQKNDKTIDFLLTDWIYTLDAETLKTIKKEYHEGEDISFVLIDSEEISQPKTFRMIKKQTERCEWDDCYIDITFWNDLYVRNGVEPKDFHNYSILRELNRFVLTIYYGNYDR